MTGTNLSDPHAIPDDLVLPAYIGQLKPIVGGGMGAVFEALDLGTGSKLAVKALLPRHLQDDSDRRRFIREAEVISTLSNVHIVELKDFGVSSSNTPYMVMEFITGETLLERLQSGGVLSIDEALEIFAQIADGLEHAHSRGVLHRDLKPSNVMLTKSDNGKLVVKIVDFGIAKFYRDDLAGSEVDPVTLAGECMGTPLYMSPEQCMAKPLDVRSDIYSLGCVLYHSLTGKCPFLGPTPMETLKLHVNAPMDFSMVPPEMRKVISRCVEKQARDRYQSMKELSSDLASLRKTGKTHFRLEGEQRRTVRKLVSILVYLIAGLVVGYVMFSLMQMLVG